MLETLAGGDVLHLGKDCQSDDGPEDNRSQGRVEIAAGEPPGLPFPELAESGEERTGEDAEEDAAEFQDGFERHGACLDSGGRQATADG